MKVIADILTLWFTFDGGTGGYRSSSPRILLPTLHVYR